MSSFRTALYQKHVDLKAKVVDFAGWDMPVQYTSVKDEVLAVRHKAGVFDVSHMGEFFVEGADAETFVDHLVTNNITEAPMGKAIYSPLCREDGTVIDDLIVYKLAVNRIMICVNASNIDKDFIWMKSLVKDFKITLTNRSNEYSLLALQGPDSEKILKTIMTQLPSLEYYSVAEAHWQDQAYILARTGYTGEDGFEIFGAHTLISKLWDELMSRGVTPCGLAARDVLRLEVGYPLYGHELNDEITPLDAALSWTVKLNKKNFIGLAALKDYKPRFKTIKLVLDKGIPREGYPVLNEANEEIGTVTSGTMSVVLGKGIATARVKIDKFNSQQKFFIAIRQNIYNATYTTKAFVQGGHK